MPIAAPIVGGIITSTIAVMILVPILFALLSEHALWRGALQEKVAAGRTVANQDRR
jgi:Cu(I)/Ag(I) efflux system membrane protein CusA/SilA